MSSRPGFANLGSTFKRASLTSRIFVCRILAAAFVVSGLSGCAASNRSNLYRTNLAWQRQSVDARSVMVEEHPDVVRVTLLDGNRFVLERARLVGDSINGTAVTEEGASPQPGVNVALGDIGKIEWSGGGGDDGLGASATLFARNPGAIAAVILVVGFAILYGGGGTIFGVD